MRQFQILGLSFFACFLTKACQTPTEIPTRLEKLGKGYCECTQQLAESNQKVQQQTASAEDLEKIAEAFRLTKTCAATLVGQFGKLTDEELAQLQPVLAKHCPSVSDNKELLKELLGNN